VLRKVHAHVRSHVPPLVGDRPPSPDIERISTLLTDGTLESACGEEVK
jgi:histidine ammonia-lyase